METLTKKAEIERTGILRGPTGVTYLSYCLEQPDIAYPLSEEIAHIARDMGYESEDIVRYKIVVEPKK